ncbi:Transmembrane protein 34 family protein [Acanthamoeba castellanii str. Neff]|uniref:Transmembrane protein 34 family protein n=1 Tax=Acanthamoeba castellanii (strain ATCC 30010 / Neff) TaxID=1257118 RepID=L8GH57_ACACF|nr:Transmembrane protein 34 family protein [Acanthamoeba castellanii str. Neff]ELR12154.1 Transmembrane protein 34 family protein [Acanthamoeba castellanii str. Neff]
MDTWEKVWFVAGLCTALSTLLSLYLVYKHLRNYTQPKLQRHIVRILLMVPIYAIDSWLSLQYKEWSLYFDLARDAYEAYVLYQFFNLLIAFINTYEYDFDHHRLQDDEFDPDSIESMRRVRDREWEVSEGRVVALLESKPVTGHPWPTCCFPPFKPGASFLLLAKRCILQFVVLKARTSFHPRPSLAVLAAVLESKGWHSTHPRTLVYGDGDFSLNKGYLWITIVDNISITVSMYFLVLFYHVTKNELKPFNPMSKFLCIKLVIMFAFWQGIVMAFLGWLACSTRRTSTSARTGKAKRKSNLIICIEMMLVAIAHSYAYGYDTYKKDLLEDGMEALGLDNIARKLERDWEDEEGRWTHKGRHASATAATVPHFSPTSATTSTSTTTMLAGGSSSSSINSSG